MTNSKNKPKPKTNRTEFLDVIKREISAWSNYSCMICKRNIPRKKLPEIAHIIPASPDGPRSEYRNTVDDKFILSKQNGILLCPICHIIVDETEVDNYPPEKLFAINTYYSEKYELEQLVKNQLFSDTFIDDVKKATSILQKNLNISEIEEEVKEHYSKDIYKKIDLTDKFNKNNFNNSTIATIKGFVEYKAINYYYSLSYNEEEIGNIYFLVSIQVLYKKLNKKGISEQQKYDELLSILKSACNDLMLDEKELLNYYFYICEVFKK